MFAAHRSAAVIAGVDPTSVRILFADGHPQSPFDSAWAKVFSGGRPPLRKVRFCCYRFSPTV